MPVGACPVCERPRSPKHRPFCSRRCADIDLGRWFSGAYAIAADPDDEDVASFGIGEPAGGRGGSGRSGEDS